jgi:hypothetical protein
VVTGFVFSSCDFGDRSVCSERQRRSTKSHEPRRTKILPNALVQRWAILLLVVISIPLLTRIAHADGGVVLCQRTAAPFNITVFFTDIPLRPGPADLSVLLEKTGHSPILDARIFIELEHAEGTIIRAEATRSQARNKLLYCSLIEVPLSGQWKMRVHVRHGNESVEMLTDLVVAAPQPLLVSYWKLIAAPAVVVILFILNQWLRRNPLIPPKA